MARSAIADVLTTLLEPKPAIILLTFVVAISLPILLHLAIYRSESKSALPSFLILGPSDSGKTSLLTLFERGSPSQTYTSQTPLSVEVSLPVTTRAASSRFRSSHDPSWQVHKRFLLVDTPGHGKIRQRAQDHITKPQNLRGIIFMVDAATLSSEESGLREAAEYLHDVLLQLQKKISATKSSKPPANPPVLVAANKQDLFTALPENLVKKNLEAEITRVRQSRSSGLLDSGIGMDDVGADVEKDWLGEYREGNFEFSQMREANVDVAVRGGSVIGSNPQDVQAWWDWIAGNL